MARIIILGAGMVGRAMAFDLAQKHEVASADIDDGALRGLHDAGGVETITVEFTNADRDVSDTVVFDPETGVQILIRETGFESNLIRALIVLLCHLTLIAALGLTAGTVFSLPPPKMSRPVCGRSGPYGGTRVSPQSTPSTPLVGSIHGAPGQA